MTVLLTFNPLGSVTASQIVMLALAIVFLTVVMISTGRRIRESRALTGRPVREKYAELENRQAARRDVEQVMLELDKLARQVHARIDTKLVRLEALIRDADRRIAALAPSTPQSKDPRATASAPRESVFAGVGGDPGEGDAKRFAFIYRLSEQGLSVVQIAEQVARPQGEIELILGLRKAQVKSTRLKAEPTLPPT